MRGWKGGGANHARFSRIGSPPKTGPHRESPPVRPRFSRINALENRVPVANWFSRIGGWFAEVILENRGWFSKIAAGASPILENQTWFSRVGSPPKTDSRESGGDSRESPPVRPRFSRISPDSRESMCCGRIRCLARVFLILENRCRCEPDSRESNVILENRVPTENRFSRIGRWFSRIAAGATPILEISPDSRESMCCGRIRCLARVFLILENRCRCEPDSRESNVILENRVPTENRFSRIGRWFSRSAAGATPILENQPWFSRIDVLWENQVSSKGVFDSRKSLPVRARFSRIKRDSRESGPHRKPILENREVILEKRRRCDPNSPLLKTWFSHNTRESRLSCRQWFSRITPRFSRIGFRWGPDSRQSSLILENRPSPLPPPHFP